MGTRCQERAPSTTTKRQDLMQAGPFLLGVACRLAVQQIGHLAQVGFDIVEFILKPGTVEAEVNRIGPVALSDGPDMAAGSAGRKEEDIVVGEDRMVLHRL